MSNTFTLTTNTIQDPNWKVFEQSRLEKALRFADELRDLDQEVARMAIERAKEILQEPLDKDTRPVIASIYRDVLGRGTTQTERNASPQPQSNQQTDIHINYTPPPKLTIEDLRARALDALQSEQESMEWKQKLLASKKESNESNPTG